MSKDNKKQQKAKEHINNLGLFSQVVGWWKIVASIFLPLFLSDGGPVSEFLNYSFTDLALNIGLGIILVILGVRIKKDINKDTKKYVWVILVLTGIFGFINLVVSASARTSIAFLMFGYSIYVLYQLKHLDVSKEPPEYKISGKRWFLVIGGLILLIGVGLLMDLNHYGYFTDSGDLKMPETDKSPEFSEQIGNLYRNTKYNFRIKFPEGWEQSPGDGPHIVRKATNNGSSVTVLVKEFPKELKEFDYKINEISSPESYMQTIKQKFPNAELLDSEYTKIDNKEAFWIKYKAPYETVDISVESVQEMYQVINNGILYQLGIGAPVDKFDQDKSIMKQSISTFVFEDF